MIYDKLQEEAAKALEAGDVDRWLLLTNYILQSDKAGHTGFDYHECGDNQMDHDGLFGYYETGYMFVNGWTFFSRPKRRKFLESAIIFRWWWRKPMSFGETEYLRTANGWFNTEEFFSQESK